MRKGTRSFKEKRQDQSWSKFQSQRTKSLIRDGLREDLARKISAAETRKRRALSQYIGSEAARSGGLLYTFTGENGEEDLKISLTIDDKAIRNNNDRLLLGLIKQAESKISSPKFP